MNGKNYMTIKEVRDDLLAEIEAFDKAVESEEEIDVYDRLIEQWDKKPTSIH